MVPFTIKQLYDKVIELAQKYPENIYNRSKLLGSINSGCYYTAGTCSNGSEGCIVGQALLSLDPSLNEILNAIDIGIVETHGGDTTVRDVLEQLGLIKLENMSDYYITCLGQIQEKQDRGIKWSECVN